MLCASWLPSVLNLLPFFLFHPKNDVGSKNSEVITSLRDKVPLFGLIKYVAVHSFAPVLLHHSSRHLFSDFVAGGRSSCGQGQAFALNFGSAAKPQLYRTA